MAYIIGLTQFLVCITNECLGVYMLTIQHTINHCIVHFVALHVVMEFSILYFEALEANNHMIEEINHHGAQADVKAKDIDWSQRSCCSSLFGRRLY